MEGGEEAGRLVLRLHLQRALSKVGKTAAVKITEWVGHVGGGILKGEGGVSSCLTPSLHSPQAASFFD